MPLTPEQSKYIKKSAPLRDRLIAKYFETFGDKSKHVFIEQEVLLYLLSGFVYCILNSDPALTLDKMKQNEVEFLKRFDVVANMMKEYYSERV